MHGIFQYRLRALDFQITLTVGYRFDLDDGLTFDGRFGGFFSTDLAANRKTTTTIIGHEKMHKERICDWDEYNRYDDLLIGIVVWYHNINLDLAYQRGFAEQANEIEEEAGNFMSDQDLHSNNKNTKMKIPTSCVYEVGNLVFRNNHLSLNKY